MVITCLKTRTPLAITLVVCLVIGDNRANSQSPSWQRKINQGGLLRVEGHSLDLLAYLKDDQMGSLMDIFLTL